MLESDNHCRKTHGSLSHHRNSGHSGPQIQPNFFSLKIITETTQRAGQRTQSNDATFYNSETKRHCAFTAISLYCLEEQQSGESGEFAATKRKCSEGSSCGDCKRSQRQPPAASTTPNFQCAARRKKRDVIHAQTRPQDSASRIFSDES